ncbi:ATPase [Thioalkalivibrio sp. HK1]|uniref:ATPase n=1 Tax=Thioalkalivibrio sp. HK1 TaxID=1469245 RepID=UPI000471BA5D|nr:ATPase [Thioalkalivibrio sp. HK1]
MKMSPDAFLAWKNKAITLLGMSGVGKTTLANCLPKSSWFHYSADYRIGTRYMGEAIIDNAKKEAMKVRFLRDLLCSDSIYIGSNITVDNLEPLSSFLGKVGDRSKGGLSYDEFVARQRLHREGEIGALGDVRTFIAKAKDIYGYDHFINDAGGSACEINHEETIRSLADHTLILYIRAERDMEDELIRRQKESPKPLYYQEGFFAESLAEYFEEHGIDSTETMDPDHFTRWIFPRLVEHRRPLYRSIADNYGYTLSASDAGRVRSEEEFLDLVAETVGRS